MKRTTYDARAEEDGLIALAQAGAPVPEVFDSDRRQLTMAWVSGVPNWIDLGRTLALVHRSTATEFGYHRDNFIGALDQCNPWTSSWGRFYAENRVRCHLEDRAVPPEMARVLDRLCDDRIPHQLEEHQPSPSLIHGDLWSGNIVDGRYLIDPAVSYSDREVELAFMAVFGGIPQSMWQAYEEAWPLPAGWQERRPILQLHHILVHVRLFGGSYVQSLADLIDVIDR